MRRVLGALGLLLVAGLVGCADGGTQLAEVDTAEEPAPAVTSTAEDAKETPGIDLAELPEVPPPITVMPSAPAGDPSPAPADEPSTGAEAASSDDAEDLPRLCDLVDTELAAELLGGDPSFEGFTRDTCTMTTIDGTEFSVATLTEVEFPSAIGLEELVQLQADQLDADGQLEAVDVGEEAFALEGEIGYYLHVRDGDRYVIAYANSVDDPGAVTRALVQDLLLAG